MKLFKAFKRLFTFIVVFVVLICPFYVSATSDIDFLPAVPKSSTNYILIKNPKNSDYEYVIACLNVDVLSIPVGSNSIYSSASNFYYTHSSYGWMVLSGPYRYFVIPTYSSDASEDFFLDEIIYTTCDVYMHGNLYLEKNAVIENNKLVPLTGEDELPDAPDYDGWAEKIFGEITSWFSGVLEALASPFTAIADGLSGVWQAVKNIPQAISDKLEYLFVPSGDKLNQLKDKFDEKFGFVSQIIDLGETILNATFGNSKPDANITIYNGTYTIIDWDIYDDYRPYVHGIIVLLSYIVFVPKLIRRLPSIIRGI